METPLRIYLDDSAYISTMQQCKIGCLREIVSVDELPNFVENFLSVELKVYQSRVLVRWSANSDESKGIVKVDARVQELIGFGCEDDENYDVKRDFCLARSIVEVFNSRKEMKSHLMDFPTITYRKDVEIPELQVTGQDIKILHRATAKTMRITVICPSNSKFQYQQELNQKMIHGKIRNHTSCYKRNLSNWKIVREKIRDIFLSYDLHVKSNVIIDLRKCPLSNLSTFVFPPVAFAFVNECTFEANTDKIAGIGHINSKTKIMIQDIHHVDYFHRLYLKNVPTPLFSSVLNVPAQKLLREAINAKIQICLNDYDNSFVNCISTNFIISGPKSCGKKILVQEVARQLQANLIIFNAAAESVVNIIKFSESLRNIFSSAMESANIYPTILLLLRLDVLFTDKKSEVVTKTGQTTTNKKKLIDLLCHLIDSVPRGSLLSIIAVSGLPYLIHPKLLRAGRLERECCLKVPSRDERYEILNALLQEIPALGSLNLKSLAKNTPGYVGTDLRHLVQHAVFQAHEEKSSDVSEAYIEHALSRVLPSVLQGSLGVVGIEHAVSLDHIMGLDSVKLELAKSIIWPIKYPSAFLTMGINPAKGLLIFGPPGCAKTTLVRAIASSNQINFLSVSSAELYSSGVGDSEKLIADLYNRARMASPCIVFIDELELIVSARSLEKNSNTTNASLLSMLLTEMDGVSNFTSEFSSEESHNVVIGSMVVTVAATNRPDLIDSALLRPGRFDKIIPVPPPDESGRLALLKEITKNMPLTEVNLTQLSHETEFFSGADLVNLCQEAALQALGESMDVKSITMENFNRAKSALGPSLTPEMLKSFYQYAGMHSSHKDGN